MTILFTCAEKECKECSKKIVSLVTQSSQMAAQHSTNNEVKMWISEHDEQEAEELLNNYEKING